MKKSILFVCFCLLWVVAYGQESPNVGTDPGGNPSIDPSTIIDNQNGSQQDPTTNPGDNTDNADNTDFDKDLEDRLKEAEKAKLEQEEDDKEIIAIKRQDQLPDARIWGQQFFRDQSISLFTRSRDIKALDSYLLGAGDEIMITFWGNSNFSTNGVINDKGYLELPVGEFKPNMERIYLKNMTFYDAKKAIIEKMKTYTDVRGSQWDIELNYSRTLTVNITGEVFNPGSYAIPAANTAFNALVASGGPSQIGSVRNIQVVSAEQETRVLDVYKFITNPNIADEFFLHNNDYVFVPLAERVVQVDGAVKRPFFYELIKGENLIQVLQYAGGLDADAYKRNIQIIRYTNDEEKLIDVNLALLIELGEDFELLDGDVISVEPIEQAYSNYVEVVGAVKLPGKYELKEGIRVREVLLKSGIIYSAVMERIYIKRLREDLSLEYINANVYEILENESSPANIELRPLDEIEVKYKSEFIDKFDVSVFGAIRKPGSYEYSRNLSLADLLYISNGIDETAAGSYAEISRLQRNPGSNSTYIVIKKFPIDDSLRIDAADQFFLEPYDQVFIRSTKGFELPKNIKIVGEVSIPGEYTLKVRNERISTLLKRAGGTTAEAFLEGAQLQRQGIGNIILDLRDIAVGDTSSVYNYALREGDVIVIPKLKDFVTLAGRINHPDVKDINEVEELKLELSLRQATSNLEREEIITAAKIKEKAEAPKIHVPFHYGKRANYYIYQYGAGIDRVHGGRKRLVYVRYPNDIVKKTRQFLFFKKYPVVEKGSIIYIESKQKRARQYRERTPLDGNRIISDIASVLASTATAIILWQTVLRQ